MCNNNDECQRAALLEGRYANYFKVGHNACEFVLDFGQAYSEDKEHQLHTRIVTSPVYAKAFFETLLESIEQYGNSYGVSSNQTE